MIWPVVTPPGTTPPVPPRGHPPVRAVATLVVVALALLVVSTSGDRKQASQTTSRPLTGESTLKRSYDELLNARFVEAAQTLTTCDGAPREACLVIDASRLFWRILLDPYDRSLDTAFSKRVNQAIAAGEAWTRREPKNAEAWFYLGGAYGARVQWRVLRVERLAAARDGKRIKTSLERALALAPDLEDANFGIGLYQYYADVAPTAAKVLRWLLLLPGGDRVEGLKRMLRARDRGRLVRGEADYQLHVIDLWYEQEFDQALGLLSSLASRYSQNPLFPLLAAEVHVTYLHDPTAAAHAYDDVLTGARSGRFNETPIAMVSAQLGLARQLDTLFESDRALEHARAVIAANARVPHGSLAEAHLSAGRALLRLGDPAAARASFDAAARAIPAHDDLKIGERLREARQVRVNADWATAYRLALSGWRAYERRALEEAEQTLARATSLQPNETVTRYRYAHVLAARGRTDAAIREFDMVTSAGATTPAPFFALACVEQARLLETRGDREHALTLYRRAAQTFGAYHVLRADARRQAARLQQAN